MTGAPTSLDLAAREAIVRSAEAAAKQMVKDGLQAASPYAVGTDELAIWQAALQRFLLLYSCPDGDGSA